MQTHDTLNFQESGHSRLYKMNTWHSKVL